MAPLMIVNVDQLPVDLIVLGYLHVSGIAVIV